MSWGRIVIIETRGRHTGLPRRAAVGFVEAAGATLLVAASDEHTHWALNLVATPRCVVEREGLRLEHEATRLHDAEHHNAVAALILKYGTPSERLGRGPAFRLSPVAADPQRAMAAS